MTTNAPTLGAALRSTVEAVIGADALEAICKQFRKPENDNRDPGMFSSFLPYLSWDEDREMFGLNEGNGFDCRLCISRRTMSSRSPRRSRRYSSFKRS